MLVLTGSNVPPLIFTKLMLRLGLVHVGVTADNTICRMSRYEGSLAVITVARSVYFCSPPVHQYILHPIWELPEWASRSESPSFSNPSQQHVPTTWGCTSVVRFFARVFCPCPSNVLSQLRSFPCDSLHRITSLAIEAAHAPHE